MADVFRLAQVEVYEVASFYHHFDIIKEDDTPPESVTVRVCDGLSCMLAGAEEFFRKLEKSYDGVDVRIQRMPCIGRCDTALAYQVGKRAVDCATPVKVAKALTGSHTVEVPSTKT
ncbi:MAG: NADH:ubiquinone oxidoreductase subunit E [Candidatus Azotimanducaceae bacterium]